MAKTIAATHDALIRAPIHRRTTALNHKDQQQETTNYFAYAPITLLSFSYHRIIGTILTGCLYVKVGG